MSRGSRVRGPLLTAIWMRNGQNHSRLGLAIAKKSVPTSVQRNLIKRQIRERFRHNAADIAGIDVVILAQPPAANANRVRIREAADDLWRQLQRCAQAFSS
jgi:ribonuclease P protein component